MLNFDCLAVGTRVWARNRRRRITSVPWDSNTNSNITSQVISLNYFSFPVTISWLVGYDVKFKIRTYNTNTFTFVLQRVSAWSRADRTITFTVKSKRSSKCTPSQRAGSPVKTKYRDYISGTTRVSCVSAWGTCLRFLLVVIFGCSPNWDFAAFMW